GGTRPYDRECDAYRPAGLSGIARRGGLGFRARTADSGRGSGGPALPGGAPAELSGDRPRRSLPRPHGRYPGAHGCSFPGAGVRDGGVLRGMTATWAVREEERMERSRDYGKAAPGAIRAMSALARYVRDESGLEPDLLELVKLRASQINGC